MSAEGCSVVRGLLQAQPYRRTRADQLCSHPWLRKAQHPFAALGQGMAGEAPAVAAVAAAETAAAAVGHAAVTEAPCEAAGEGYEAAAEGQTEAEAGASSGKGLGWEVGQAGDAAWDASCSCAGDAGSWPESAAVAGAWDGEGVQEQTGLHVAGGAGFLRGDQAYDEGQGSEVGEEVAEDSQVERDAAADASIHCWYPSVGVAGELAAGSSGTKDRHGLGNGGGSGGDVGESGNALHGGPGQRHLGLGWEQEFEHYDGQDHQQLEQGDQTYEHCEGRDQRPSGPGWEQGREQYGGEEQLPSGLGWEQECEQYRGQDQQPAGQGWEQECHQGGGYGQLPSGLGWGQHPHKIDCLPSSGSQSKLELVPELPWNGETSRRRWSSDTGTATDQDGGCGGSSGRTSVSGRGSYHHQGSRNGGVHQGNEYTDQQRGAWGPGQGVAAWVPALESAGSDASASQGRHGVRQHSPSRLHPQRSSPGLHDVGCADPDSHSPAAYSRHDHGVDNPGIAGPAAVDLQAQSDGLGGSAAVWEGEAGDTSYTSSTQAPGGLGEMGAGADGTSPGGSRRSGSWRGQTGGQGRGQSDAHAGDSRASPLRPSHQTRHAREYHSAAACSLQRYSTPRTREVHDDTGGSTSDTSGTASSRSGGSSDASSGSRGAGRTAKAKRASRPWLRDMPAGVRGSRAWYSEHGVGAGLSTGGGPAGSAGAPPSLGARWVPPIASLAPDTVSGLHGTRRHALLLRPVLPDSWRAQLQHE